MGPHLAAAGIRLVSIDFPGACVCVRLPLLLLLLLCCPYESKQGSKHTVSPIRCACRCRARYVDAPLAGRRLPFHRLRASVRPSVCTPACLPACLHVSLCVSVCVCTRWPSWPRPSIRHLTDSNHPFPTTTRCTMLWRCRRSWGGRSSASSATPSVSPSVRQSASQSVHPHLLPHPLLSPLTLRSPQHLRNARPMLGAAIGIALAGSYPEAVQRVVTVEALGLVSRPADTAPQVLRCVFFHCLACLALSLSLLLSSPQ